MWRSHRGWRTFGIVRPRPLLDVALTAALFVGGIMVWWWSYLLVWTVTGSYDEAMGYADVTFEGPSLPWHFALLVAASIANGLAEELVMRGYLIPRLHQVTGSVAAAVCVSSILFGAYHIYQGVTAALAIMILGVLYGSVFVLTGRLWPLVAAHALADFIAYMPVWE